MKITIKKDKAIKRLGDYYTPENLNCAARKKIMSFNDCLKLSCKECDNKIKEFFRSRGTEGEIDEEIKVGDLVERESQIGVVSMGSTSIRGFYIYNLRTYSFIDKSYCSLHDIKESGWKKLKGTAKLTNDLKSIGEK